MHTVRFSFTINSTVHELNTTH